MATSLAIIQAQILALQQSNKLLQERRNLKRKPIRADHAVSVGEGLTIIAQEQVSLQIENEMPRLARKLPTCSNCKQQGHTKRNCKVNALDTTV